jgi:AdoMet-dependent heme synthase
MSFTHQGAADLLAARAARTRSPTAATLQVTDRCNYECVHCYQEHGVKPELSFAEIERILGELADAGVLFLVLMGGEFFMRRDADEILQLAHDLGFAIRLKTTGHHVTEKRADFLATIRPLEVDVSLYAAGKHEHEQVTRNPGSWERSVAATRRLIARKIPVVLRCPVMQSNAGEIAALEVLAKQLGAEVSFDPKIVAHEDYSLEPVTLRMDGVTLKTFYRDAMSSFLGDQFNGYDACTKTRNGHEVNPVGASPCGAGQRAVAIDPQGVVWPCNVLTIPAGDLRTQSFREIWFGSEALEEVRSVTWAKLSECNVCEVRPYCSRCHAMALVEHGTMYGPSLEACRHAVAVRDSLRERGQIPATETALPPTWDRIDADGQHQRLASPGSGDRRRPASLRILP